MLGKKKPMIILSARNISEGPSQFITLPHVIAMRASKCETIYLKRK
jgi:hypothetical protein